MADLLRQGAQWLEQMRKTHCSSTVEYHHGAQTLSVSATFGKTGIEVTDESGITVDAHVWDFLIQADDLGFEPTPGDTVVADGRQYEVLPIAGERCWRWSDPYRVTYRIHTKDIGAEQ